MRNLLSFFGSLRSWLQAYPLQRRWLTVALLWSVSALLLFPSLGTPRGIVFDETYYIPMAQRYLNHQFYVENHPPLARLFIALGQNWLHSQDPSDQFVNDATVTRPWPETVDIAGYRLFPAIFGSLLPLLTYLILLQITRNDGLAAFSGLAVALDNALVTQSHFALPDSALLFFCFLTLLLFTWLQTRQKPLDWKSYGVWALFGASAAAAFLVKLTGLFVIVTFPFYLFKLWKTEAWPRLVHFSLVFGGAFLVTFVLVWQIHFSLLTNYDPNSHYELSELQRALLEGRSNPNPLEKFSIQITDSYQFILKFHENIPALDLNKPDEIGSAWYQWPLGGRAIPYRWESNSHLVKMIYLIGNPAVWLISLLGVLGGLGFLLVHLFRIHSSQHFQWYLLLGGMYLAYMLPIARVTRVMYLYHYLPPLLIGIMLFALVVLDLSVFSNRTKVELLSLALIWMVVSFWVYSPFTYYAPLTYFQVDFLNIWTPWDLRVP